MSVEREMTLTEYVGRLPEIHAARKELATLQAKVIEAEQARDFWQEQNEATSQQLIDCGKECYTLQARNKELEAECVAAKDYMVKCGEHSSLDAKRIAELEAAARWIPVEKGMHLPDEDAYIVRISRPKGYDFYAVAQQTEDGGLEDMDGVDIGYESRDISHWMPLPQPPSKGE